MVPKIHPKRRNFRSTAGYLLHDPNAPTADRVEWTSTRNLATRNPDSAWRVMAATSMDQDRLKREAGVPNTGRKSKDHVLHFTLSWHPEEADKLDRREMLRAATTVLHVMKAQEHQCLIVAHSDRPQPHVHVLVNRVNPKDGRILSSSFEKLRASRWAQQYEEERGKIYCAERVLNNAARDRGEYTRGEKDEPRPVHEAVKAANDNHRREAIRAEHRKRAALLKEVERRQAARHKAAWEKHQSTAAEGRKRLEVAARRTLARRLGELRTRYRPAWRGLHDERDLARREFEKREERLLGRVSNALRSVDLASLVRKPDQKNEGRLSAFRQAFQLLADAGARREVLDKKLEADRRGLLSRQRRDEAAQREAVRLAREATQARERQRLDAERNDLVLTQSLEQAKLRTQWQAKSQRLRDQLRELRAEPERSEPPIAPVQEKTRPSDLAPQDGAPQAARQIDGWRAIEAEGLESGRDKERDDGVDR